MSVEDKVRGIIVDQLGVDENRLQMTLHLLTI